MINTTAFATETNEIPVLSQDIPEVVTLQKHVGRFNHRVVTLVADKTVVMRGLLRLIA